MLKDPAPDQNRLLAVLPTHIYDMLLPQLELVSMPLGKVLYESGDVMRHVYFPIDCIISLLYVMENGASAEISVVGNEGVIGISLFMGGESTSSRALVQSAGQAYRLSDKHFKDAVSCHVEMLQLMLRYVQALITQMAQTAVCNRHHSIDQQLCRWLLLSLDRLPSNQLSMTQELIANMLGFAARELPKPQASCSDWGSLNTAGGRLQCWTAQSLKSCVVNATRLSKQKPTAYCLFHQKPLVKPRRIRNC